MTTYSLEILISIESGHNAKESFIKDAKQKKPGLRNVTMSDNFRTNLVQYFRLKLNEKTGFKETRKKKTMMLIKRITGELF